MRHEIILKQDIISVIKLTLCDGKTDTAGLNIWLKDCNWKGATIRVLADVLFLLALLWIFIQKVLDDPNTDVTFIQMV